MSQLRFHIICELTLLKGPASISDYSDEDWGLITCLLGLHMRQAEGRLCHLLAAQPQAGFWLSEPQHLIYKSG